MNSILTYELLLKANEDLKQEKVRPYYICLNEYYYKLKFFASRYETIHRAITNANQETNSFISYGIKYIKVKSIEKLSNE